MYCVIMGDIVNSRKLSAETRQKIVQTAQKTFDRINTNYMGALMADFDVVRGDAFEGILLTQSFAPQIVQDIIKAYYSVDKTLVRISVVLDELVVTDDNRNKADGPAFHHAIDQLEEMKKSKSNHWLQVHFNVGGPAQELIEGQLASLTAISSRWTNRQREVVWAMEESENFLHSHSIHDSILQRDIKLLKERINHHQSAADTLGIMVPVVKKHLTAANYDAYRKGWNGIIDYFEKMDDYAVKEKLSAEESYIPFYNVAQRKIKFFDDQGALKPATKALELAKKTLNENDRQFIDLYNTLAEVYKNLDKYDEAENYIAESLRIQESMPKTRLEYAMTLSKQAYLLSKKEKFEDSLKLYETALEIVYDAEGAEHPFLGILYNNIAVTNYDLNRDIIALDFYKKSLDLSDENDDPINYAISLENIAFCYYNLKNIPSAISYLKKSIEIYEKFLPAKHDKLAEVYDNLNDFQSHTEATP